jgi:transcriptional regulator
MDKISGDALRGHLELIILSLLEQGEAHGYEILRRLEAQGSGVLRMREGSLYPVLYRLEEAGQIRGTWETEATKRRGPRRRIYRLTPKGKRVLARHRQAWRQFVDVIGRIAEGTA